MIQDTITQFIQTSHGVWTNSAPLWILLAAVWVVQGLNACVDYHLNKLGVLPRTSRGLWGIVLCPFLHGNFKHAFLNSIPLTVLGALILVDGQAVFVMVTGSIILLSGVALWVGGRRAWHVGASALVMGYWSYVLLNAYTQRSVSAIVVAILCVVYFGSLIYSLLPEERSSWEGHVFGFLAGLVVSYFLAHPFGLLESFMIYLQQVLA